VLLVATLAVASGARMPARADAPDAGVAPATTALQSASFATVVAPRPKPKPTYELPVASGQGRRIVFDQGDQRVWLVGDDGVERTYPVSGSRFDNLHPGTYDVQSKARHATSFDYSGTMEYFVRFTTGWSAPIGFHSIPVYNNGKLEQSREELGTPLSAGCIRQWEADARALWDFAGIGTTVVVTA